MGYSNRANSLIGLLKDRPVAYHPALALALAQAHDRCGVKEAVFVSQMLYWDGKGSLPNGWIWKTGKEWTAETGLSRYEQETVREHLIKIGILEEKLAGVPATLHYRLDIDKLVELLDAQFAANPQTEPSSLQQTPEQVRGNAASKNAASLQRSESTTETTTETTPETVAPEAPLAASPLPGRGKELARKMQATPLTRPLEPASIRNEDVHLLPGLIISRNRVLGESVPEDKPIKPVDGDSIITCTLCGESQPWPSSETQRRKAFNLTCQVGESKKRGGCGGLLRVLTPKAAGGEPVLYEHPLLKRATGYFATFSHEQVPRNVRSLPIVHFEDMERLVDDWTHRQSMVINKLRWASEQKWMQSPAKRKLIIPNILAAINTTLKGQTTPKPAVHSVVTEKDKVVDMSWFDEEDD